MAWNQGAIRLDKGRATASENRRELSEEEAVQEQKIQRIILSYCIRFLCKSEYQVHVAQQLQNLAVVSYYKSLVNCNSEFLWSICS